MLQVLLMMIRGLFVVRKKPWLTTISVSIETGEVTSYERRHLQDGDNAERCWSQRGEIWVVTKGGYENAVGVAQEAIGRVRRNVLAEKWASEWSEV